MDKRIESFLADVLALEGEDDNAIHSGARVLLPTASKSSEHGK